MRFSCLASLPVAFVSTCFLVPAQSGWVDRQLATSPPARNAILLAWVPAAQRIWWLGFGTSGIEVWDYDGLAWAQMPTTGAPPPAIGPATYDPNRQRIVGVDGNDVWEFDGASWTKITPAQTPTPVRRGFDLVYDGARNEVLMGGGEYYDNTAGQYGWYVSAGDLWAWTGTTWVQRYSGGGGGGRSARMVYDPDRQLVISYGGDYSIPYYYIGQQTFYVVSTVWEWDGTSMQLGTSGQKRTSHAIAYDKLRQRVVTFGGFATCGYACSYQPASTDEFTSGGWTYRTPATSPPPRNGARMAYDERRQRLVMYGGSGSGPIYSTWEYFTPNPARFATFGAGCAGSSGTPALALDAGQLPWLGSSIGLRADNLPAGSSVFAVLGASNTMFGSLSLPLSLAGSGAPLCSLLVSPDVVVPAGTAGMGGVATWSLAIPNDASLQGMTFYVQAAATDAGANPLGLVFTEGGAATVDAL